MPFHHKRVDRDGDSLFPLRPLDEDDLSVTGLDQLEGRGPWFEVLTFSRNDFGGKIVEDDQGAVLYWTDYVANDWHEEFPSTAIAVARFGLLLDGANREAFFKHEPADFATDQQDLFDTYLHTPEEAPA